MKLFKDYSHEFEELKKDIDELKGMTADNRVLIKLADISGNVQAIHQQNELIQVELTDIKRMIKDLKPEPVVEPVKKAEEPFEPVKYQYGNLNLAKSSQKEYKYTKLGENYKFNFYSNNRFYQSSFTIFDILLLKSLETEEKFESWTSFTTKMGIDSNLLRQVCFNIKDGFFDKFIDDFSINFSKNYGLLYVDGKKANVSIKTVRYIVECMQNSSKPMTTLLKLEKSRECSKLLYRIIGTNWNNPELVALLKHEKVPVENNPQKRKEMGR